MKKCFAFPFSAFFLLFQNLLVIARGVENAITPPTHPTQFRNTTGQTIGDAPVPVRRRPVYKWLSFNKPGDYTGAPGAAPEPLANEAKRVTSDVAVFPGGIQGSAHRGPPPWKYSHQGAV